MTNYGNFKSYTEHLNSLREATPGLFLGYLCWYGVPEGVTISYDEFLALTKEYDSPLVVKAPPKATNIFMRACTAAQASRIRLPTNIPDVYRNYLVRDAGNDTDWICRQVVRELVDGENHDLEYEIIGDLKFHKRTNELRTDVAIMGQDDEEWPKIVASINQYMADNEGMLTAYAVRESFRQGLTGKMQSVSVRPAGGVYFVGPDHTEELAAVEKMASDIDGVSFQLMPLIDDGNQRAMLKVAFEADSTEKIQEMMGEATESLKAGKITVKQMARYWERFRELKERTQSYSSLLDDTLTTASVSIALCEEQLKSLMAKVD